MGRVRFYSQNGESYCTLRVEDDGLYILSDKVRIHKERTGMPPKRAKPQKEPTTSTQSAQETEDDLLLVKILQVFDDLEQSLKQDEKGMVSIKPAYKKEGYQVGLNYNGDWSNYPGRNILECILQYFREVVEQE